MLAQIALVSFALMGILSLVIDIGIARVTQGQMQTAADVAALEGLRQRDAAVVVGTGQIVRDPFGRDCLRRTAAHRVVRQVFDDDLDPTSEDPNYSFGAGPIIDLTEGEGSFHAMQTISVPDTHVYKPNLQLNQLNAVDGDMVSGRFCYSVDPAPSEDAAYGLTGMIVCTEPQRGGGRYARNDFNPSGNTPQPPSGLAGCPAPDDPPPTPWPSGGTGSLTTAADSAFLVRLRRSNELRDLAGQTEPDVASSGPSLPLLFGRGAAIHGDDPAFDYSPRRDGLTVRATAIAEVRPALRVGLPQSNPAQPGVTPFALVDTFVRALTATATPVTINAAGGLICRGLVCAGAAATVVGRFVDSLVDPSRTRWTAISTVGRAVPAAAPVSCASARTFQGYGPVYSLIATGGNRVIGFSSVQMRPDPARPADPCAALLSKDISRVAWSNATAALSGGLEVPAGTSPAAIRELLDKHFERRGLAYSPVLVPVLAR